MYMKYISVDKTKFVQSLFLCCMVKVCAKSSWNLNRPYEVFFSDTLTNMVFFFFCNCWQCFLFLFLNSLLDLVTEKIWFLKLIEFAEPFQLGGTRKWFNNSMGGFRWSNLMLCENTTLFRVGFTCHRLRL